MAGLLSLVFSVLVPLAAAPFHPGYSHTRHYISELGQTGAPVAAWVNWAGFLPTGLCVFVFLALVRRPLSLATNTLLLLSSLGWAYVLSAIYPCDPGCPVSGSLSQTIHNLTGIVGCPMQIVGMWQAGRAFQASNAWRGLARPTFACSLLTALGFLLMLTTAIDPWRGLVQRVFELVSFGWIAAVGWAISGKK